MFILYGLQLYPLSDFKFVQFVDNNQLIQRLEDAEHTYLQFYFTAIVMFYTVVIYAYLLLRLACSLLCFYLYSTLFTAPGYRRARFRDTYGQLFYHYGMENMNTH